MNAGLLTEAETGPWYVGEQAVDQQRVSVISDSAIAYFQQITVAMLVPKYAARVLACVDRELDVILLNVTITHH